MAPKLDSNQRARINSSQVNQYVIDILAKLTEGKRSRKKFRISSLAKVDEAAANLALYVCCNSKVGHSARRGPRLLIGRERRMFYYSKTSYVGTP